MKTAVDNVMFNDTYPRRKVNVSKETNHLLNAPFLRASADEAGLRAVPRKGCGSWLAGGSLDKFPTSRYHIVGTCKVAGYDHH